MRASNSGPGADDELRSALAWLGGAAGVYLWLYLSTFVAAQVAGGRPAFAPLRFAGWTLRSLAGTGARLAPWEWAGVSQVPMAPGPYRLLFVALLLGLGAPALVGIAWWRGPFPARARPSAPRRLNRPARLAEIRRARLLVRGPQPGRVLLGTFAGRRLFAEREVQVLVYGPARSGKTSAIVIPNLLSYPGPVVATSTREELVRTTAGYRQQAGGRVAVWDPTDSAVASGLRSALWSPVPGCRDLGWARRTADRLVAAGLGELRDRPNHEFEHWNSANRKLLFVALWAADMSGFAMKDIRDWLNDGTGETLARVLLRHGAALHPDVRSEFLSVMARPERERGSCFSTVQRHLEVFAEPAVARNTSLRTFDPEEFLDGRPNTLYLCAPAEDQRRVAPLMVALLSSLVSTAYRLGARRPLDPPLLLLLDELANIVPLPELDAIASQGAGHGVQLVGVVQDHSQLRARYGERAGTIFGNCACKVFMKEQTDPETLRLASELAGFELVRDESRTAGGRQGRTVTTSFRERQMLTPAAVRQIAAGGSLLVYRRLPPAFITGRPYWRDPVLLRRSRMAYSPGVDEIVDDAAGKAPGGVRRRSGGNERRRGAFAPLPARGAPRGPPPAGGCG